MKTKKKVFFKNRTLFLPKFTLSCTPIPIIGGMQLLGGYSQISGGNISPPGFGTTVHHNPFLIKSVLYFVGNYSGRSVLLYYYMKSKNFVCVSVSLRVSLVIPGACCRCKSTGSFLISTKNFKIFIEFCCGAIINPRCCKAPIFTIITN